MQVLTLGALINCVELRESVENCFLVGALRVPAWTPTGKKTAGLTISVKASDARCNAVEFLSRMLMKCTEGFAKHLEAGNGEDEAEGEQKMVPEGVEGGPSSPGDVLRQGKPGQESSPMRTTSGSQKGTPSLTTGVESEEAMTPAEGAQLVLAGHCALLLGLLVREHEPNRFEEGPFARLVAWLLVRLLRLCVTRTRLMVYSCDALGCSVEQGVGSG